MKHEQSPVKNDNFQPTLRKLVIPLAAIIAILAVVYFIKFNYYNDKSQTIWGAFGDYFGGVAGPIIGVFTVWGAWYAYVAQRDANRIATNQFEEQNKITTFFELMSLYQTKTSSISLNSATGRSAIGEILIQYKKRYYVTLLELAKAEIQRTGINSKYGSFQCDVFRSVEHSGFGELDIIDEYDSNETIHEVLISADSILRQTVVNYYFTNATQKSINELLRVYSSTLTNDDVYKLFLEIDASIYADFGNEMGHYFRNIAQILLYISACGSKEDEFRRVFRAQLSRFEIAFLAYNCLSPRTSIRFNKLVARYDMFDDFFPGDTVFEMKNVFTYLIRKKNRELLQSSSDT